MAESNAFIGFDGFYYVFVNNTGLLNQNNKNRLIAAYFLTDALHPLINKQVIDLLNESKEKKIKYGSISYNFTLKAEIVD